MVKFKHPKPFKLPKLHCQKCDYWWIPRREDVKICARCKSSRWDEKK